MRIFKLGGEITRILDNIRDAGSHSELRVLTDNDILNLAQQYKKFSIQYYAIRYLNY